MDNWQIIIDFFAEGIPGSEYIWVPIIIGVAISSMLVAKKMVSDI